MLLGIFYGPTKGPLNPWSLQSLVSSHFLKNTSWYLTIWASCQNIDTPINPCKSSSDISGDWKRIDITKDVSVMKLWGLPQTSMTSGRKASWSDAWGYRVVCPTKLQFALVSASGFGCLVFLRVKLINWKQMLGQMKEYEMCAVQLLIGLWEVYCYWHISACAMTYNI